MGENLGDHCGAFDGGDERQAAATVRTGFPVDFKHPSKTPTWPQLLLNSAAIDRLGALALYLRSEKRWFKILSI